MNSTTVGIVPKVGDILYSTFGHNAILVRFAKVIAVTKASVKIERLGTIENPTGPMSWESRPNINSTGGTVQTKRFKVIGENYYVKDSSFATFSRWDGKVVNCYNYH